MDIPAEDLARLQRQIEASVGPAAPEDTTTLTGWAIYEARLAHTPHALSRHLVGWAEEAFEGRTSSAVVEFDVIARTASTESGRLYRLRGKPGPAGDARHVWGRFVKFNHAIDVRDITAEVFPDIVAQLGMPGDVEFKPALAAIESPPADLIDDELHRLPLGETLQNLLDSLDGKVRQRAAEVVKLMDRLTDGAKLAFFQTPKGSLNGKTPLEALAAGQVAAVRAAAEAYAQA